MRRSVRRLDEVAELSRENVERLAHIIGPSSAAAAALSEADAHDGPCTFLRMGSMLIVAKHPRADEQEGAQT